MAQTKRGALPARVENLRVRFERWWRKSKKRSAIPEPLWSGAVGLARRYGVRAVARALRLDYYFLKRRTGDGTVGSAGAQGRPATFVEVDVGPSPSREGGSIEVERRDGSKLTIRLRSLQDIDVLGLTNAFSDSRR